MIRKITVLFLLAAVGCGSLRAMNSLFARSSRTTPQQQQQQTAPITPSVPVPGCVPAPAGLIGWWPFDGNGSDFFWKNNAVLTAGSVFTTGRVAQALHFDGVGDVAVLTGSSTLNVGTS